MSSVLLVLLATVLLSCEAQQYYVTPTPPPNPACPDGKPCHTLSYYASNVSALFRGKENVSLLFLDGVHEFSDQYFIIHQVHALLIAGINSIDRPQVLMKEASILLRNVSRLRVENVMFYGLIAVDDVISVTIRQVSFNDTAFSIDSFANTDAWLEMSDISMTGGIISIYLTHTSEYFTVALGFYNLNTSGSGIIITRRSPFLHVFVTVEIIDCSISNSKSGIQVSVPAYLALSNSVFSNNRKALSLFNMFGSASGAILSSVFVDNTNRAVFVQGQAVNRFLFQDVFFIRNYGALTLLTVNATVDSCYFDDNSGPISSAIAAFNSSLFFAGNTTFSNNRGGTGGAIYLSTTIMWLENNTNIHFVNNSASQTGGAIFVGGSTQTDIYHLLLSIVDSTYCFYRLTFDLTPSIYTSLTFENNSAQIGGDDIYGTVLSSVCLVTPRSKQVFSFQVRDRIFNFKTPTLSSVSSGPKRVCLCENGVPQCANIDYIYYSVSVAPGEKFNLSVVLVGGDFGTVTGGVYASSFNETKSDFYFTAGQDLQQITQNQKCTDLEYTVHLTNEKSKHIAFLLSRDSITASSQRAILDTGLHFHKSDLFSSIGEYQHFGYLNLYLLYAPVVINVTVLLCPLGFELLDDICQCEGILTDYVHSCTVVNNTGILYRNGTTWISSAPGGGNSSEAILSNNLCPFDYCKTDTVGVDLYNPDEQCTLRHGGILCGGCPPNLSLAIGSSQCLECPNNNFVTLVFVFIVAGVALVFFIKIFDLTIARGTTNGLIFYVNAIWINQAIFFPSGIKEIDQNLSNFFQLMRVFIAWLNLDFGIETCFIKGLDAYWKTWLQFVFPIYLWIIAGLIILVCRYSTRATKFFGNNAVAVLATLILMSYVKLLRTIVSVLGPAVLQQYHPEGTKWVWLLDGNVTYLGLRHAFLFVAAVLFLLFLWLPYTILLLFIQILKKLPCFLISRFLTKLKPFLDTYTGPLKDKHQYWIGLTLLVRVTLAVTAVAFGAVNPIVSINLLGLVSGLLCILVVQVYKKLFVSSLDILYLFNLVVLCSAFLSTDVVESHVICTCVSVVISFLTFIGILVYHTCTPLSKHYFIKRREYNKINDQSVIPHANDFVTKTTVDLREELLESAVDNVIQ